MVFVHSGGGSQIPVRQGVDERGSRNAGYLELDQPGSEASANTKRLSSLPADGSRNASQTFKSILDAGQNREGGRVSFNQL